MIAVFSVFDRAQFLANYEEDFEAKLRFPALPTYEEVEAAAALSTTVDFFEKIFIKKLLGKLEEEVNSDVVLLELGLPRGVTTTEFDSPSMDTHSSVYWNALGSLIAAEKLTIVNRLYLLRFITESPIFFDSSLTFFEAQVTDSFAYFGIFSEGRAARGLSGIYESSAIACSRGM